MKAFKVLLAAAVSAAATTVMAQSAKPLLGVPFGDSLKLSICPFNTDGVKKPCWVGKSFFYQPTGSTSGMVHLPGADQRPAWAAYASFNLTLDKDGRVQHLRAEVADGKERHKIADSISLRFGTPFKNELALRQLASASWRSPEGTVEMLCGDKCWVDFRTPKAQAERDAELAERARKEAARPSAP